jgi:calpain
MEFDDFVREFEELESCNLGPEVMNEIAQMTGLDQIKNSAWTEFQTNGAWLNSNGTAGGCRNYMGIFVLNTRLEIKYFRNICQQSPISHNNFNWSKFC